MSSRTALALSIRNVNCTMSRQVQRFWPDRITSTRRYQQAHARALPLRCHSASEATKTDVFYDASPPHEGGETAGGVTLVPP